MYTPIVTCAVRHVYTGVGVNVFFFVWHLLIVIRLLKTHLYYNIVWQFILQLHINNCPQTKLEHSLHQFHPAIEWLTTYAHNISDNNNTTKTYKYWRPKKLNPQKQTNFSKKQTSIVPFLHVVLQSPHAVHQES